MTTVPSGHWRCVTVLPGVVVVSVVVTRVVSVVVTVVGVVTVTVVGTVVVTVVVTTDGGAAGGSSWVANASTVAWSSRCGGYDGEAWMQSIETAITATPTDVIAAATMVESR